MACHTAPPLRFVHQMRGTACALLLACSSHLTPVAAQIWASVRSTASHPSSHHNPNTASFATGQERPGPVG